MRAQDAEHKVRYEKIHANLQDLKDQQEREKTAEKPKALKITKLEVQRWINTGNELISRLKTYVDPARSFTKPFATIPRELDGDVQIWIIEVDAFVVKNAPDFVRHYHDTSGLPSHGTMNESLSIEFVNARDELANRVARLEELRNLATQP